MQTCTRTLGGVRGQCRDFRGRYADIIKGPLINLIMSTPCSSERERARERDHV